MKCFRWMGPVLPLAAVAMVAGCDKPDPWTVQGYVEGEFIHVAAPRAGRLESLSVERGDEVAAGQPLFALDAVPERSRRDEAARRVEQARALLEDAKRGLRPTEIAGIEAELAEAEAARDFARDELARRKKPGGAGAIAAIEIDRAESNLRQAGQRVNQLQARLATAKLGSREEQVAAAENNLQAQQAALTGAEWALDQMSQKATVAGRVSDIVYRPGDWVPAGGPVVELLPPGNVKVRVYVPETMLGQIQVGDPVELTIDGRSSKPQAKVSFISPRAEYTPPVIYSEEMREKLVFLIELTVPPEVAATLHPGQPLDARFSPH